MSPVIAVAHLMPPAIVHALQALCMAVWLMWVIADLRRSVAKRRRSGAAIEQEWMFPAIAALTAGAGSLWMLVLYWPHGWFGGFWGVFFSGWF